MSARGTGGSDAAPFCSVPGHPAGAHGGHPEQSVPVPVLEALASAWEDQAAQTAKLASSARCAGTLADCARMLREAISKGSAG